MAICADPFDELEGGHRDGDRDVGGGRRRLREATGGVHGAYGTRGPTDAGSRWKEEGEEADEAMFQLRQNRSHGGRVPDEDRMSQLRPQTFLRQLRLLTRQRGTAPSGYSAEG